MVSELAQVIPRGWGSSELNTVLLTALIGLAGWIGKKAIAVIRDLRDTIVALATTVSTLHTTLLGTDDQGGLVRRVEGVSTRVHQLANDVAVLKAEREEKGR